MTERQRPARSAAFDAAHPAKLRLCPSEAGPRPVFDSPETFRFGRRLTLMIEYIAPEDRDELFALYAELHLACGRAAAALHAADNAPASEQEQLARFRAEEERAACIWARIVQLRRSSSGKIASHPWLCLH